MEEETEEKFKGKVEVEAPDLCLFCLRLLPQNWKDLKTLETVNLPDKQSVSLSVRLDDKEKNYESFAYLCEVLGVRWSNSRGVQRVDKGNSLPLCVTCQLTFQEAFQLQLQIIQLGKLMKERINLITEKIRESEERKRAEPFKKSPTFEVFGLHQIREKIISKKVIEAEISTKSIKPASNPETFGNQEEDPLLPASFLFPVETVKTELPEGDLDPQDTIDTWNEEEIFFNEDTFQGEDSNSNPIPSKVLRTSKRSSAKSFRHFLDDLEEGESEEKSDDDVDFQENEEDWSDGNDEEDEDYETRSHKKKDPSLHKKRGPKRIHPIRERKKRYADTATSQEKDHSLTCHICDEDLPSRKAFIDHYDAIHPDEKKYTCKFCGNHYNRLRDCQAHQWRHTGDRPFQCNYCEKAYNTKKARNNHQRWIHEGKGQRFPCSICSKVFHTQAQLNLHGTVHDETVVICKACGVPLKSIYSFDRHNKTYHNDEAERSEPLVNPSEEVLKTIGVQVTNLKPLCHICWKPIYGKQRGIVQKHFEEVHGGANPLACSVCGKTCSDYKETRKHAYRHLGKKTEMCDKCDKCFVTKTELRNHSLTHLAGEDKPKFVCDVCGAVYTQKCNLSEHRKTHKEGYTAPTWFCDQCGKSYQTRKSYSHHKKKVHLGETPHKCEYCGKGFVGPGELQKHLRIHTGVKPYPCPHCDKAFPYTHTRARHVREVHQGIKDKSRGYPKGKKGIWRAQSPTLSAISSAAASEYPTASSTAIPSTSVAPHSLPIHPFSIPAAQFPFATAVNDPLAMQEDDSDENDVKNVN